jgi:hypothetical protein
MMGIGVAGLVEGSGIAIRFQFNDLYFMVMSPTHDVV